MANEDLGLPLGLPDPERLRTEWVKTFRGMRLLPDVHGPSSAMAVWEPGDATRYLISVIPVLWSASSFLGYGATHCWSVHLWSPARQAGMFTVSSEGDRIWVSDIGPKLEAPNYTITVTALVASALIPNIDHRSVEGHAAALRKDYGRVNVPGFTLPKFIPASS